MYPSTSGILIERISISNPCRNPEKRVEKKGVVDFEAEATSIPKDVVESLELLPADVVGKNLFYFVNISVMGKIGLEMVKVFSGDREEVVIGTDNFASLFEKMTKEFSGLVDISRLEEKQRREDFERTAASIAHKIGNRMLALGAARLVLEIELQNSNLYNQFSSHLVEIKDIVNETRKITERFLSLSKPLKPDARSIDINAVLRDAVEEMLYPFERIEKDFNLDERLPLIEGSPSLLKQAFSEIVANSANFMKRGGRFCVVTKGAKEGVHIELIDTGPGVAEEDKERIFKPFFSTREENGTGLGLSIAKKIIDVHNGTIEEKGTYGGGARFRIFLPIKQKKEVD